MDSNLWRSIASITAASLLLTACTDDAPEDRLQEAAEQVATVQDDIAEVGEEVSDARSELEERKADVREAEQALASARKELRKLQQKLAAEQEDLDSTASDTAIFRLLQTRLLDDDVLASEAINLFVLDGTVVLYGEVQNAQQKSRAGNIAAETPGVSAVRNFVELRNAEPDSSDS